MEEKYYQNKQSNSLVNSQWAISRERLEAAFYQKYDHNRLLAEARAIAADRTLQPRFLGSGYHFRAFQSESSEARVLSIAQPSFYQDVRDKLGLHPWIDVLLKLSRTSLPLIPPIEVLLWEEQLALVLPYGEQPLASYMEAEPKTYSAWIAELSSGLTALGLRFVDGYQGRVRQGDPFLCDFSDLRPIRRL